MGSILCCLDRNNRNNSCFNCTQGRRKPSYDFEPEITNKTVSRIYNTKYT